MGGVNLEMEIAWAMVLSFLIVFLYSCLPFINPSVVIVGWYIMIASNVWKGVLVSYSGWYVGLGLYRWVWRGSCFTLTCHILVVID